jgi:hypothetical protein
VEVITFGTVPEEARPIVEGVCEQLVGLPYILRTAALAEATEALAAQAPEVDLEESLGIQCADAYNRQQELDVIAGWSAELGASFPGLFETAVEDDRYPSVRCDAEGFSLTIANPFTFTVGMVISLGYASGETVSEVTLVPLQILAPGQTQSFEIGPSSEIALAECVVAVEAWVAEEGGGHSAGFDADLGLYQLPFPPPETDSDDAGRIMSELLRVEFAALAEPDPVLIAEIEDVRSHNFLPLVEEFAGRAEAEIRDVFEGVGILNACFLDRVGDLGVIAFLKGAGTQTISVPGEEEVVTEVPVSSSLGVFRRGADDGRWRWLMTAVPIGTEDPCGSVA